MGNSTSISGPSKDIGAELAKVHLPKGGGLVLVASSKEALDKLDSEIDSANSIKIVVTTDDLAKSDSDAELSEAAKTADIQIGTRINEPGIGAHRKAYARDLAKGHARMQVNMDFLSNLTYLYLQGLTSRDCRKN